MSRHPGAPGHDGVAESPWLFLAILVPVLIPFATALFAARRWYLAAPATVAAMAWLPPVVWVSYLVTVVWGLLWCGLWRLHHLLNPRDTPSTQPVEHRPALPPPPPPRPALPTTPTAPPPQLALPPAVAPQPAGTNP